jgi:hypothetical protein
MILAVFSLLLAAFLVWVFWPKKETTRVEVQRVEELDWNWPAWPAGHERLGGKR